MKMALSIDTGVNAIGWALWRMSDWAKLVSPCRCGVIRARGASPLDRMLNTTKALGLLAPGDLGLVVVEWAQFRAGSSVGHSAASRDDLGHLCHDHGMLHWWACCKGATFKTAPVSAWKGNLPKRVVEERIKRGMGDKAIDGTRIDSHAWDAVGIGLWAKGFCLDGKWCSK